jgi:hypothetical protein
MTKALNCESVPDKTRFISAARDSLLRKKLLNLNPKQLELDLNKRPSGAASSTRFSGSIESSFLLLSFSFGYNTTGADFSASDIDKLAEVPGVTVAGRIEPVELEAPLAVDL